jgi:hypothetical protein
VSAAAREKVRPSSTFVPFFCDGGDAVILLCKFGFTGAPLARRFTASPNQSTMGNLKKKRRLKMNKHKRRKRLKANRHKKRTWQK